jgi:hypothetical protein
MGSFEARKSRASKLPIPLDLAGKPLNLTALEEYFRIAAIGRVAQRALVGRKSDVANTPDSAGM